MADAGAQGMTNPLLRQHLVDGANRGREIITATGGHDPGGVCGEFLHLQTRAEKHHFADALLAVVAVEPDEYVVARRRGRRKPTRHPTVSQELELVLDRSQEPDE